MVGGLPRAHKWFVETVAARKDGQSQAILLVETVKAGTDRQSQTIVFPVQANTAKRMTRTNMYDWWSF